MSSLLTMPKYGFSVLSLLLLVACGGGGSSDSGSPSGSTSSSSSSSSSGGASIQQPVISQQPESFRTEAGTIAVFSVKADSATPLSYQWRRQGSDIAGATSSSYAFRVSASDDGSDLSVKVSNTSGSVISNPARLSVAEQLGIVLVAGQPGQSGVADGAAASALFSSPAGLALDSAGNLFVADAGNRIIRKISTDGTVSTFAGKAGEAGTQDGAGASARFGKPEGLAFDGAGNLYVADTGNNSIRKITPGALVSTLYKETQTIFPSLAVNASGTVYYGVWVNSCAVVKVFAPGSVSVSVVAGDTTGGCSPMAIDGMGTQALIHPLKGLTVDSNSNLLASTQYIVSMGTAGSVVIYSLVKITASGQKTTLMRDSFSVSSTFIGPSVRDTPDFEFGDLTTSSAYLASPSDIFVLANGNLCPMILKYREGGTLKTVAGQCGTGTSGLKLGALPGSLKNDMRGLVMDKEGSLYTTSQNAILKIRLHVYHQGG